jgi:hypothetical protein
MPRQRTVPGQAELGASGYKRREQKLKKEATLRCFLKITNE